MTRARGHLSRIPAIALVAAVAAAGGARADLPATPTSAPSAAVIDALTGIDFVAQRSSLDVLLGPDPVSELDSIATSTPDVDPGVRLRAVRALSLYPSVEARTALTDEIAAYATAVSGVDLLQLRTAVEALGVIGQPEDVATIVPLLNKEESRDVRAAAATALRDIGSSTAIMPLRARLAKETVPQVTFAISDALRVLSGSQP
jgi:HEAT repeat protein